MYNDTGEIAEHCLRAEQLEILIKYKFQNISLAIEALTQRQSKNARLAILGDAAAGLRLWYEWYSEASDSKGRGDSQRQALLNNENLARRGKIMNIHEILICEPGIQFISSKMVATAVEAVIGAVFQDGGINAVGRVLETMFLGYFD